MTTSPSFRLRHVLVAALLCVGLLGVPVLASVASADPEAGESTASTRVMNRNQEIVLGQVNTTRANNQRSRLPTNGLMNKRAMKWAAHLVSCQCLEHRAPPFGTPGGWCGAAENVGRSGDGGKLADVHNAFLNSRPHRENILNRSWTAVGVGAARDRAGEYFVVHAFADFRC